MAVLDVGGSRIVPRWWGDESTYCFTVASAGQGAGWGETLAVWYLLSLIHSNFHHLPTHLRLLHIVVRLPGIPKMPLRNQWKGRNGLPLSHYLGRLSEQAGWESQWLLRAVSDASILHYTIPMVTLRKGEEGQLIIERLFLDFWPDALTNLLRERKWSKCRRGIFFSPKDNIM